jgi:hypothetical protein
MNSPRFWIFATLFLVFVLSSMRTNVFSISKAILLDDFDDFSGGSSGRYHK